MKKIKNIKNKAREAELYEQLVVIIKGNLPRLQCQATPKEDPCQHEFVAIAKKLSRLGKGKGKRPGKAKVLLVHLLTDNSSVGFGV
ncbi:hypothetical protein BDV35DRAFT_384503 [Aspergillus flavus]|uniref:Uncharacterized protein n=1 Tax=Aspergillus flavus TaxID=5059 RepID=A0A5N6GIV0_ASPFL|nr:hypothetical protein BDV35DRAFT_384503 [Aspergillus flavus]